MAINFLNSVDFNQNELLHPVIENQGSDTNAGTSVDGQIYFNTTNNILKVSDGAGGWKEVGGGVETLTAAAGTFITFAEATNATGAVNLGTFNLSATGSPSTTTFLRGDNTWATPPDENDFLTGLSFNTTNGLLTATVQNQSNVQVDLDGRYALSSDIPGTIVESVTGGRYLTNSGTAAAVVLDHDLTDRTDTTSTDSPGYGGSFAAVTSVTTNTTGHVEAINVETITLPAAEDYTWTLDGEEGTSQDVENADQVNFVGGTNITTTSGSDANGKFLNIDLNDSITLAGTLTVNGTGDSSFAGNIAMGSNSITGLADPTNPQDAATKNYVDDNISGGLIYQGGYNAATNTPDLDGPPSPNNIKQGWTYTVTNDGLFFTEQVRVGDVLIAEVDAPSALADWTTVQNNVDLADLTTVGIGNVNADTGIDVTYSGGTATVENTGVIGTFGVAPISTSGTNPANISIADATPESGGNLGAIWPVSGTAISITYDGGTRRTEFAAEYGTATDAGVLRILEGDGIDVSYGANGNVTISTDGLPNGANVDLNGGDANVTRTEAGDLTTFEIDVNAILGTTDALNVKVEVISSAGQTVYADVTRTGTGTSSVVNVIFAGSVSNSSYRALLVDVQ